jgi:hypothetical protein
MVELIHLWTSIAAKGGENLMEENENGRGEMVWGQPSLIYVPITHFSFALRYFRAKHLA